MIKWYQKLSTIITIVLFAITPQSVLAAGSELGVVKNGETIYLSTAIASDSSQNATIASSVHVGRGYADTIGGLITSLLTLVMLIASLLVLLQLVVAAFGWLTSGGDKGKTEEARNKIIAAIVGVIIIAASWAIFLVVLKFLGFGSYDDLFANLQPISS